MAQGDSIVGICNASMIALGEDPITSVFPPDPTKRAILCSLKYDQVRREVLRSSPWECAKKLALLAASPTAPLFKWRKAYPLPPDYIRTWEIQGAVDADDVTWEIVNGQLLTDEDAPLQLEYVFDLQDPTLFDPLLAKAIGRALALDLAEALTQSEAKKQSVKSDLAEAMATGTLVDSQDDGPQVLDNDVWLRSRA